MASAVEATLDDVFALERVDAITFRAAPIAIDERRAFGGLLVAQALAAATATVDDAPCHALHALFSSPAAVDRPTEYTVATVRDGRRFAARRVEARQGDRLVLTALVSFHAGDVGPEHAVPMPDLPPPESLPARAATRRYVADLMLDVRPVEDGERRALWFRPRASFRDDPATRRIALAFASDMGLVHVALKRRRQAADGTPLDAASLDHAIWFHRDPPASDWLVQVQRATTTSGGRGMAHGEIFTRDGLLVATTAQEILCREPVASGGAP